MENSLQALQPPLCYLDILLCNMFNLRARRRARVPKPSNQTTKRTAEGMAPLLSGDSEMSFYRQRSGDGHTLGGQRRHIVSGRRSDLSEAAHGKFFNFGPFASVWGKSKSPGSGKKRAAYGAALALPHSPPPPKAKGLNKLVVYQKS